MLHLGFMMLKLRVSKQTEGDEVAFNVDHYDLPLEVQQKLDTLANTTDNLTFQRRVLIPIVICQGMLTFILTIILCLTHFDEAVALPCAVYE